MTTLYDELQNWQTGIGALLGFVALMVAALWNSHLNRRRDASLRGDEARSVAAALYGEIILLRKEVALLAKIVANIETRQSDLKIDEHFVEAHALPGPILYPALASKVGLLSPNLVLALVEFHKNYQTVRASLPLLVEKPERGYTFSPLVVLRPASDAVYSVVPALRTIESLCSIAQAASDPELGMTEEVIEQQNAIHSDLP